MTAPVPWFPLAVDLDDPLPRFGVEVPCRVGESQVAAGSEGLEKFRHDAVRVVLVAHQVQKRHHGEGDRLTEVQGLARRRQDLPRFLHVGLDVRGTPLRGAVQKRLGVSEDDRIVVGVHHAGVGGDGLDDLVKVRGGRNSGTDVEELTDALSRQHSGGTMHEVPVGTRHLLDRGEEGDDLLGGLPVDGIVVLAVEEVVIHARRLGFAGVDVVGTRSCVCHLGPPPLRRDRWS